MSGPEVDQRPSVSWQTFVLAASVPLGPFRQVHLAPRFPPGRLNLALRTELPLLENELLVALIDSDSRGFQSTIILTTSRLYWFGQDEPETGRRSNMKTLPLTRLYGLDYALLGNPILVELSPGGVTEIALGSGRSLPLRGADPELAEVLATFLRTVGDAARTGATPPLGGLDPELRQRISQVLPSVAEVTRRIHTLNRDLHAFRRDLLAATPRALVTPVLTVACVAIFVAMVLSGVDPILPAVPQLVSWGANAGARVALRHEWWRLPASVFIHGGLIHLGVNMWCLFTIGPLVERFFGNLTTAGLYLAAGIGGAIASMATMPVRVSVGASGAIFGMLGAILAFLIIHRHTVPATVLRPLRSSALSFVVFNTLFGAAVPNIDQAAHMGGLATGFLGGLLLIRPWPVVRSPWLSLRRLVLGLALAGTLLGAGVGLIRWRGPHCLPLPATRISLSRLPRQSRSSTRSSTRFLPSRAFRARRRALNPDGSFPGRFRICEPVPERT